MDLRENGSKMLKENDNRTYIALYFLLFLVFADSKFLTLLPLSPTIINRLKYVTVVIAFLFVALNRQYFRIEGITSYHNFYCVSVIGFLLVQGVYVSFRYGSGIMGDFIKTSLSYIYVFLIVPVYYVLKKEKMQGRLFNRIAWIVVALLSIILLNGVIYNISGKSVFHIERYWRIMKRAGRLRLWDLSSLEGITAVWLFWNFVYKKKHRLLSGLGIAVILSALFYVEQSRMMQIDIIISMAAIYLVKESKGSNALIRKITVILLAALFILFGDVLDHLSNLFSTSGEYGYSSRIRLDEIDYALGLIKLNPFNGTGLVSSSSRDSLLSYNISGGHLGYTDIGIIGLLAQIGIWAVILFAFPVGRMVYILIKTRNNKGDSIWSFLLGLLVFIVSSSTTLIMMNPTRIFGWPFCVAAFECWYYTNISEDGFNSIHQYSKYIKYNHII